MRYREKSAAISHDEQWDTFSRTLANIDTFLTQVYYDGLTTNSNRNSDRLTHACNSKYFRFLEDGEENLATKLFILPANYPISSPENIDVREIPDFPTLPELPQKILLDEWEYAGYEKRWLDDRRKKREGLVDFFKKVEKKYREKKDYFLSVKNSLSENRSRILRVPFSLNIDIKSTEWLIYYSNSAHWLPTFLRRKWVCKIDAISRIACVQFEFPDYSEERLVTGYKIFRGDRYPKYATDSAKNKYIKSCLYSLIIRAASIASRSNLNNLFDSVVVNVEQSWFDLATGKPRSGIIASLQAPSSYLVELDLSKLNPEVCFKHLKGLVTPNISNLSPIRPIIQFDTNDDRLVSKKDIASNLDEEANLAAMEWEDFEHLVAQLFEWEFAKNGIEVKVTRASRDRGVDAILFDPDPLRGGKYVLQAKRYTRTVDVSAVRDLYGTVMNEGANRGILITTASYGPDAYEFAKDKPISLVDGQNLLAMLQKHGRKYRIDLEEARRLSLGLM